MNNEEIREKIQKYQEQLQANLLPTFELNPEIANIREKIKSLQQVCSHCNEHKFQLFNGRCIYCGKNVNNKKGE